MAHRSHFPCCCYLLCYDPPEFFQLIVSQLFDVSYGMFLLDDETRTFRFNPDSLDSPMEFELVGAVLGIAIYNSTIVGPCTPRIQTVGTCPPLRCAHATAALCFRSCSDMHLPRVIYKQLLNQKPDLDDLLEAQPSLAKVTHRTRRQTRRQR